MPSNPKRKRRTARLRPLPAVVVADPPRVELVGPENRPDEIAMVLPEKTPTVGSWQRLHWSRRRLIAQRFAWLAVEALGRYRHEIEQFKRFTVHVRRHSTQEPDRDGLIGGLKPLLDALQPGSKRHPYGIGLIYDDAPSHMLDLTAEHVPSKAHRTEIRITRKD